MLKVNKNYNASGSTVKRIGNDACEAFGKRIAEGLAFKNPSLAKEVFAECGISLNKTAIALKESMGKNFAGSYLNGSFKEDLTTSSGAGAYTKLLHQSIITKAYDKLQETLDAVIVFDDLKNLGGGFGSLQIPIGQPTVAYEVAEGQVINRFDEGVTEITIVPRPIAAGTAITWRMTKRALPSIMQWILNNASNAVYRKIMKDIVDGITTTAGSTLAGFDAAPYDTIIQAEADVNSAVDAKSIPYGFEATHLFLSYSAEATLRKSADWKSHVQYAVAVPGDQLAVNRNIMYFGRLKMVTNPFIGATTAADRGFVLDRNYAVAYVPESDVESFEGQISGRPYDREIALIISIGQATLYPKAIVKLSL